MSTAKKLNVGSHLTHAEAMIAQPAIISPFWDALLAGGLSAALFALVCVTSPRTAPEAGISLLVFNLSFVINFPHFLASYQLLYGDFRHKITKDPRFMVAGIVVPIILAIGMIEGFAASSPQVLGYFLVAMFFFVGWHYVKQTFGVMVVSNAYRKIFYNSSERFWLQANMYSLWAVSFFNSNTHQANYNQLGINYPSLNLSEYPLNFAYSALVVSILGNVYMHVKKYVREGVIIPASSFMAYLAIYIFLLPQMIHPFYAHMSPAFHSLQYLLFVFAYQRNKVESETEGLPDVEARRKRVVGLGGFFLGAIVLGALSFSLVPSAFDKLPVINRALFGATPFVFFATVFINIHHYFIDNVIWKGNNPEIKKHLFRAG